MACRKGSIGQRLPRAGRADSWLRHRLGTLVRASCDCWAETEFVGSDESADGLPDSSDRTCNSCLSGLSKNQNK